jgi:hypothetical protein
MTASALRHAIAAGLAGLLFAQAASADSVSGQFELDGKALTPSEVAAFRIRDQFNPREFITYVMLTTRPVQREAIAADSDPYTAAINDDAAMHADYLAFFVRANGETSMNVSFDSAVLSRPAGKPLPKDGGEPGQTLLALVAAAQGDDLSKIIALLTPGEAEDYQRDYNTPEENLANAKQMFDFTLPKQPKITGGELLDDNTALLEVEGVPYEGTRILYLVRIERHDGRWGYASSQRVGMLD